MSTDTPAASTAFAVVPDEVSDAGRYVQQTAADLISGLRSASADVSGLMSSWRGSAANAYSAPWGDTHTAALGVFDALADMADLLGVVSTEPRPPTPPPRGSGHRCRRTAISALTGSTAPVS